MSALLYILYNTNLIHPTKGSRTQKISEFEENEFEWTTHKKQKYPMLDNTPAGNKAVESWSRY